MKLLVLALLVAGAAANECLAFFDQGGGSYTAELYSSKTQVDVKVKSKELLKTKEPRGQTMTSMPPKWLNPEKGTFDGDYSKEQPESFPAITGILTQYYTEAVKVMEEKCELCRGKISKVVIRQTGKIRAELLGPRKQHKSTWDKAMNINLKKAFPGKTIDYALLPNADEAKMEGEDFFRVQFHSFAIAVPKAIANVTKVVAAGIGSSSTQMYAMPDYKIAATGDSVLGAIPGKVGEYPNEKAMTKETMPNFSEKFRGLIDDKFHPAGKTFVAMNAVGYNVKTCMDKLEELHSGNTSSWLKLKSRNLHNEPIPTGMLKDFAEKCIKSAGKGEGEQFGILYAGSLLLGIADAIKSKGMANTILECKFEKWCSIPGGAKWTSAVARQTFPKAK